MRKLNFQMSNFPAAAAAAAAAQLLSNDGLKKNLDTFLWLTAAKNERNVNGIFTTHFYKYMIP
jgi:hypothetical protein